MQPPSAPSQAFGATRSARLGRWIDAISLVHRGALMRHGILAVSNARVALPNFYNVAIRIANVAARLAVLGLWLRDEFGSPTSPQVVARLNIGDADVHEAVDKIGIGRDAKYHRRFVGRRTAADVDDEPRVRDLDVARRALVVASTQNAASEDLFIKSERSFDVGDGDKKRDGHAVLRRHFIGFLFDASLAHG